MEQSALERGKNFVQMDALDIGYRYNSKQIPLLLKDLLRYFNHYYNFGLPVV